MNFLGITFFSGRNSFNPTPPYVEKNDDNKWVFPTIDCVRLQDAEYNHLFFTHRTGVTVNDLYCDWDVDDILNADFDDYNANAGNTNFSLWTTDTMIFRRRMKGTQHWTTLYKQEIHDIDDFMVSFIDYLAVASHTYEYEVCSYAGGIENGYIINEVDCDYAGFYMISQDMEMYGTPYNPDLGSISRDSNSQSIGLLNSRFPVVVANADSNYDTGQFKGLFVVMDDAGIVRHASYDLREHTKDLLMSKKPYVLKTYAGHSWIARTQGTISEEDEGHPDLRSISFEWAQIGDAQDNEDLYAYGFLDIPREWW